MPSSLAQRLLAWYAQHKRQLPWRDHPDPYAVWVSEIMLQQTRVETVLPYYARWMQRFPDIASLAAASQQEVLALWEGLGYYSRARNLHRAAQVVMQEHDGELPLDLKALRALPGIGRYTAGAIASLGFGLDEPVVDGNVKRVLGRFFSLSEPVDTSAGERRIWELAAQHLPSGAAGDYNQALMELGALVCRPKKPDCTSCPLKADCEAYALGLQEARPVTRPKEKTPLYTDAAAVIRRGGRVLIRQRPQRGLLGGMWEFPGGRQEADEDLAARLKREIKEGLGVEISVGRELGVYDHAYTHFRVRVHAFECELTSGKPKDMQSEGLRWVRVAELADYPMGKLDRQISERLGAISSPAGRARRPESR